MFISQCSIISVRRIIFAALNLYLQQMNVELVEVLQMARENFEDVFTLVTRVV
jgi:hypothetical protein